MTNIDQMADVFLPEPKPIDAPEWGIVRAVNADGSYQVQLRGSSALTRCDNYCTAVVGDRVKVMINANGRCDVIGRWGGTIGGGGGGVGADWVEDFGEEGIWTWVKYASGRAECWGEWIGSYGSQIAADGYGYVDVPLPAIFAEREPAHITPSYQAYRIDKVYDNAEQMNDEGELVANVDYVRMLIWADGSSIPTTAELSFSLSVKGIWKELERPEGGGSGGGAVTYSQGDVSDWIAGKVFPYAGTNEPIGSLLCDGRAVSRREYWELFDAIGTTYGAGDGSTTFNLPNIESRTIIGESDSYALGSTGGEEEHTLTIEEMPRHGHPEPRTVWNAASGQIDGYVMIGDYTQTTTQSIGSQGGDQPHNNMQPYIVMRYFITTGKGDPASGINPADYVVEWGNTDGWRWEKWASGKARCWKTVTLAATKSMPDGNLWYYDPFFPADTFPFEFREPPAFSFEQMRDNGQGVGLAVAPVGTITTAGHPSGTVIGSSEGNYTFEFVLVFSGEWKDSPASGGTETIAPTIAERFEGIEADLLDMSKNKVLATTASYMNADQTITMSEPISAQPNGIVLVWSWYDGGAKNWDWVHKFIPKHHPNISSGGGVDMFAIDSGGSAHMAKYVYVTDTQIVGHSRNGSGAKTLGGLAVNNGNWVLRYVIGV